MFFYCPIFLVSTYIFLDTSWDRSFCMNQPLRAWRIIFGEKSLEIPNTTREHQSLSVFDDSVIRGDGVSWDGWGDVDSYTSHSYIVIIRLYRLYGWVPRHARYENKLTSKVFRVVNRFEGSLSPTVNQWVKKNQELVLWA